MFLFSPFSLWGHRNRKKWITDTKCRLPSQFFNDCLFSYLWFNLHCLFYLCKHLSPHAPATNREKKEAESLNIYVGFCKTLHGNALIGWHLSASQPLLPLKLPSLLTHSGVQDQAYLVTTCILEEMLNSVSPSFFQLLAFLIGYLYKLLYHLLTILHCFHLLNWTLCGYFAWQYASTSARTSNKNIKFNLR